MWHKPAGHENDHVDGRTGTHFIRLANSATGAEHHVYIRLGVDSCPHCNRAFPKNDLGAHDPKAIVAAELEIQRANHDALMAYAAEHGIPVKSAHAKPSIPVGFRAEKSSGGHMLHPIKVQTT